MTFEEIKSTILRSLWLPVIVMALASPLHAQEDQPSRRGSRIIDDTTRQVYGPTTSSYFFENDVFLNIHNRCVIDTLIRDFHHYTPFQSSDYTIQDLGNIATASRPIFYQVPGYIGVSPGFEVYDLYWEANKIRYFDTLSDL